MLPLFVLSHYVPLNEPYRHLNYVLYYDYFAKFCIMMIYSTVAKELKLSFIRCIQLKMSLYICEKKKKHEIHSIFKLNPCLKKMD